MVTHTLLVMWTARRTDGIRFDSESVHVGTLASNDDMMRIKKEIRDLQAYEPIETVIFRNVVVLETVELERATKEFGIW